MKKTRALGRNCGRENVLDGQIVVMMMMALLVLSTGKLAPSIHDLPYLVRKY